MPHWGGFYARGARSQDVSAHTGDAPHALPHAADAATLLRGVAPSAAQGTGRKRGFGSPRKRGCPPKMLRATSEPLRLSSPVSPTGKAA